MKYKILSLFVLVFLPASFLNCSFPTPHVPNKVHSTQEQRLRPHTSPVQTDWCPEVKVKEVPPSKSTSIFSRSHPLQNVPFRSKEQWLQKHQLQAAQQAKGTRSTQGPLHVTPNQWRQFLQEYQQKSLPLRSKHASNPALHQEEMMKLKSELLRQLTAPLRRPNSN